TASASVVRTRRSPRRRLLTAGIVEFRQRREPRAPPSQPLRNLLSVGNTVYGPAIDSSLAALTGPLEKRMTARAGIVVGVIAWAVVLGRSSLGQDSRSELSSDETEAFVWIDGIDAFDSSKLVFGRAATGSWEQVDGGPPTNTYYAGFLVQDDGRKFVVRGIDLDRRTFVRNGAPEPHKRVDFEPRDLEADARALAARIRAATELDHDLSGYHSPQQTVRPIP